MGMKINEGLARFMRTNRQKMRKTQEMVAKEIGIQTTSYNRLEGIGKIPKDAAKRENLAKALGVEKTELLGFLEAENTADVDILSLLGTVMQSGCKTLSLDDIEFLYNIETELETPLTKELIRLLLEHRNQTADQ